MTTLGPRRAHAMLYEGEEEEGREHGLADPPSRGKEVLALLHRLLPQDGGSWTICKLQKEAALPP